MTTVGWLVIASITGAEECERRGWTFRSTTIDKSWSLIREALTGYRGVDDQLITDLHELAKSRLDPAKVTEEECQATLQLLADAGAFGGY